MKVRYAIVDSCHPGWGEDRIIRGPGLWGVADGATPVDPIPSGGFHSQAERMVASFAEMVARLEVPIDYPAACAKFVNATTDSPWLAGLGEVNSPSFTTAAVTVRDGELEVSVLGDCSAYIEFEYEDLRLITDTRVEAFSAKTRRAMFSASGDPQGEAEAVRRQKSLNRRNMNVPGGYWTVAYRGNFEAEFLRARFPLSSLHRVLLCSDGFSRLFDLTPITPWDVLSGGIELRDAVTLLRWAEDSATGDARQIKRHDDAAAILLWA